MEETITIRLPSLLANRLREENTSPATVIVQALEEWLARRPTRSEPERTWAALAATDLLEPLGVEWEDLLADDPLPSRAQVREALRDVPPLSPLIIAEREQGIR